MATSGGNLASLFADPNFQALLAGIGGQLAPEGVGGALGRPTTALIQNRAAQTAITNGRRKEWYLEETGYYLRNRRNPP